MQNERAVSWPGSSICSNGASTHDMSIQPTIRGIRRTLVPEPARSNALLDEKLVALLPCVHELLCGVIILLLYVCVRQMECVTSSVFGHLSHPFVLAQLCDCITVKSVWERVSVTLVMNCCGVSLRRLSGFLLASRSPQYT